MLVYVSKGVDFMNFNEILKSILCEQNLRQSDLCRMTGIQSSLMSDYMKGKKSPTIGNAISIATALNVSLDTLVGKQRYQSNIKENNSIHPLIEIYERLNDEGQHKLMEYAEDLDATGRYKKHNQSDVGNCG